MQAIRCSILGLAAHLLAACSPAASNGNGNASDGKLPAPSHQVKTEIVEVPVNGIDLGWGYNLYDDEPLPNICVEFSEAEEPAQTRTLSMTEVNDTYEVMKKMGMTAEASVKTMGYEASGKASFAKNLNISGTSSNFVLDASVDNGVRYAAPYDPGEGRSRSRAPAIRLTSEAERLARKPEDFLRECGNAFVSAVYSGAHLTGIVSIKTSSHAEREQVRAEVAAKGYGATISGTATRSNDSKASKLDKSISVFLVGGRGDAIPKDQAELEAKLETLSYSAYEAPKDFRMAVTPYELLPNWPQERELRGNVTEFQQLAGLWGDYNTLYDEIEYILENPSLYGMVERSGESLGIGLLSDGDGDASSGIRYLEKLQDYVHLALRELEGVARDCLNEEENGIDEQVECSFDEARYLSSYAFRSQLPLELAVDTAASTPQRCTPPAADADATAVRTYETCRTAYLGYLQTLADSMDTLDRRVAKRWIIDKSQGRCRFDVLDIGCLTNDEVRHWQSKVGQRLTILESEDDRRLVAGSMPGLAIDPATGETWTSAEQAQAIGKLLSAKR